MLNKWQARAARLIAGEPIMVDFDIGTPTPLIPLPRLPLSLFAHAQELFTRCYLRCGRCIGVLLVFDTRDLRWLPPRFPRQICGLRRAYNFDPSCFDEMPPHLRVLGCLQSAVGKTPSELIFEPLPLDGIFAVVSPDTDNAFEEWFLRVDNQVIPSCRSQIAVNDWQQTLTAYQRNLRID